MTTKLRERAKADHDRLVEEKKAREREQAKKDREAQREANREAAQWVSLLLYDDAKAIDPDDLGRPKYPPVAPQGEWRFEVEGWTFVLRITRSGRYSLFVVERVPAAVEGDAEKLRNIRRVGDLLA